jgi:hypothetical protein
MIKHKLIFFSLLMTLLIFYFCEATLASDEILRISEEIQITPRPIRIYNSPMSDEKSVKIVVLEDKMSKIIFFDMGKRKLFCATISDESLKIVEEVVGFDDAQEYINYPITFPNIFIRENIINVVYAAKRREDKVNQYDLCFLKLNRDGSKASLDKRISLTKKTFNYGQIHIFPLGEYGDSMLVVGEQTKAGLWPWDIAMHLLSAGHGPTFTINHSWIINGTEITTPQQIETHGRVSSWRRLRRHAVSRAGEAHSLWIRDYRSDDPLFGFNSDQSVCYSRNMKGEGWSEPIELFRTRTIPYDDRIKDIAIVCDDKAAYVLWADEIDGLFFAEIREGKIISQANISKSVMKNGLLEISAGQQGDVVALMSENKKENYEITILRRLAGKWTEHVNVMHGPKWIENNGIDLVIDNEGIIHMVYCKGVDGRTQNIYYRKIIPGLPKEKKLQ